MKNRPWGHWPRDWINLKTSPMNKSKICTFYWRIFPNMLLSNALASIGIAFPQWSYTFWNFFIDIKGVWVSEWLFTPTTTTTPLFCVHTHIHQSFVDTHFAFLITEGCFPNDFENCNFFVKLFFCYEICVKKSNNVWWW